MAKLKGKKWEAFTWRDIKFTRSVLYPGTGTLQWKSDKGWVHTNGLPFTTVPPSDNNQCVAFLRVTLVGFYEAKGTGSDPIKALDNALQNTKASQQRTIRQYLEAQQAIDELEI